MHAKLLQSCLTLCDPINCRPPHSSVHGILQTRIPEWVAMPFSRGSSRPRDRNLHLLRLLHWEASSLSLALSSDIYSVEAFTVFKTLCESALEKAMAPHSSTLAWEIPWMEEPGGLQSMGSLESDMTERLHFHFSLSRFGEGNGNPLQCSCLENPRDREPGGLQSMGSHRVGTEATQQQQ